MCKPRRATGPWLQRLRFHRTIENSSAPEDREERQEQAQDNAQDDAGNDRKIKYRMLPPNADIAGQSSHPFRSEAAPHHQSDQRRNDTDDQNEFAQVAPNSISCANCAKAQPSQ